MTMKIYKKASKIVSAYHGSNKIFSSFDTNQTAQGVVWFSTDMDKIVNQKSGANSAQYIYSVDLEVENTTGWDDYEKKFLSQIEQEGFDSIKLDDDWIIFDTSRIHIKEVHERTANGYQKI